MSGHCCSDMERHLAWTCEMHPDGFDCPDQVIDYRPQLGEYGLIIHDGGSSHYAISLCSWCGQRLLPPGRDESPPPEAAPATSEGTRDRRGDPRATGT